jgi:REP element-mobilizing transposase RayT
MARAKRHYIPGHIWHITHRCHKREFLLKFAKDRRRWLHWLLEAKRRYGLVILNYMVTSNHIHLLVIDDGDRDVIPRSIQLVAGRTAREYNQRKKQKGALLIRKLVIFGFSWPFFSYISLLPFLFGINSGRAFRIAHSVLSIS